MTLTRRNFIRLTTATGVAALTAPGLFAGTSAQEFYADAIVIDGMGFPGGRQPGETSLLNALELEDIAASGLSAAQFTVGDVGTMPSLEAFAKIVGSVTEWEGQIDANPEILQRVRAVGDIRAARASGRIGLIYGLQDGVAFEDDISRLKALWQLGIRVIQPTYNRRNLLGDGCMEPANAGLSRTVLTRLSK